MPSREMNIDGAIVNDGSPVYVIAEIGHNHQGDIEQCKKMFDVAKAAGAHSVKLQKRNNRALFTDAMYNSPYNSLNSFAETYGEHREYLEFNRDQYAELQRHAKQIGITFFSTAFDIPSADFLEDLDMPAYKMASGDLKNIPLLKHVAKFGKPMFISTGGGTMEDVQRAYDAVRPINDNICIMQCTSGYPPTFEQLDIRVIETYREAFPDIVIGFSSHDSGVAMPLVGYMMGMRAVEKHFTLNRTMKGTDQAFSLEPQGLEKLARDLERARIALGDGVKRRYPSEEAPLLKMEKSLVAARDLQAGHVITAEDIAYKVPGKGLAPYLDEQFIGRTITADIRHDDQFTFALIAHANAAN